MTQFASVNPEHFEGTIEYDCRIHGEECYGCAYEAEWEVPFEPTNRLNPILEDVRKYWEAQQSMDNPKGWDHILRKFSQAEAAGGIVTNEWERITSPEMLEHARKVLTRLANISKEVVE